MDFLSAFVQSLCIAWEKQSKIRPRILGHSLAILCCYENLHLCLYMLLRLLGVFGFPEVIMFTRMLTPEKSERMQYQVHKLFPHAVECFLAYFSHTKHPALKASVTQWGTYMFCKFLALCSGSSKHTHKLYIELCSPAPVTVRGEIWRVSSRPNETLVTPKH